MTTKPSAETVVEMLAQDLNEGILVQFDGERFELMSVRSTGQRLAFRLSDGSQRIVSKTTPVEVIL